MNCFNYELITIDLPLIYYLHLFTYSLVALRLRTATNYFIHLLRLSIIAENLNSEKSLITDFPLSAPHFSYDETSRTRVLVSIEKSL